MPNLNPALNQKFIEKSTELFFTYLVINKLESLTSEEIQALGGKFENGICTFDGAKETLPVKDLAEYNIEDYKKLLAGTSWKISESREGKYRFSTEIEGADNQSYTLGGADKIDLNALHISNLGKMIRHLSGEEADKNMLVTMTTGSGKTFTQAILLMAEYLSGVKGVFVLPREALLTQFLGDIQKLIPENMYDSLTTRGIVLTTVEKALSSEYNTIEGLDPTQTLLSFDEAHLLSEKENYFFKDAKSC